MDEYINKTKFEELMRKKARSNFDLYYADTSKYYYDRAIGYSLAADEAHDFPVADVQLVNQWISVKDRLPEEDDEYLAVVDGVIMEVGYTPKQKGLICVWSTCDADGFKPLPDDAVTHWMSMPEPPKNSDDE